MDTIDGRYLIEKPFDMDSESRSFVVLDSKTNTRKLLRLFNKGSIIDVNHPLVEDFLRYRRISHENILLDYDFDLAKEFSKKNEDQYFYTKEYIDHEIIKYVDLNYQERLFVLEQVLYALSYLHFMGFVYGKLSFSNLMIYRDDKGKLSVKLNDIASIVLNRTLKFPSKKDSIFYVSGMELDQLNTKSDIFSLGMLTYYLLTGSDYLIENVDYEGLETIDERIASLISRSINMDVSKRPNSVIEFWKEARDILGISFDFKDRQYYENLDFSSAFIVHKDKRDTLVNKISEYFDNNTGNNVTFIRSKTGMGKSRFLSEIEYFSKIRNINTILLELEEGLEGEYPNFSYIVNQILINYSPSSSFIEKYGEDLLHLVPEYRELWNIEPSVIEDELVLKNRITSRFISLIEWLSSKTSSLIILDNVDKLNPKELELLVAIITSSMKNSPYLVLSASNMPHEVLDWCSKEKYSSIKLGPFNHHQTVNYISNILNIGESSKEIAREINGLCHGNPRKIENTILYMLNNKRIEMTDERVWTIRNLDLSYTKEEILALPVDEFNQKIYKLSKNSIQILNHISVFNQQVDVFFAINFFGLGGKRFNAALEPLIRSDIIQKSITDWGNYYEFKDDRLAGIFYNGIVEEDKIAIHKKIADFYEDDAVNSYKIEFDSYIYHLIKSKQAEKAILSLKENAKMNYKNCNLNEAVEYYEYALSISETHSLGKYRVSIMREIANLQYSMGELEKAEKTYKDLLEMSKELGLDDIKLLSMEKLIEIFIFQNRLSDAESMIMEVEKNKDFDFDEEYLIRLKYLAIKLKLKTRKIDDYDKLKDDFIEFEKIGNDYYKALISLDKASFDIASGKYLDAKSKIEKSMEVISQYGNEVDLIIAYRALSMLAIKYDNDFDLAINYYKEAYSIAEEKNVLWKNSSLLVDIGYLNMMKSKYMLAKKYFQLAERYASNSSQVDVLMSSVIKLSKLSIILKDYDECKILLDKYSAFFEKNKGITLDYYYYSYLLVKSELFLELREFEVVDELISTIEKEGIEFFNSIKRMDFRLHKIKFEYIKYLLLGTRFNYNEIATLIMMANSIDEKNMLKDYLMDFAIDAYLNSEEDLFEYIYEQIQIIRNDNESSDLSSKLIFCDYLKSSKVDDIRIMVDDINTVELTFRWKIYCILADLQYKNEDYVYSLANYIEARGQFFDSLESFPIDYRVNKIGSDLSLSKIENRIIDLQKKLYGLDFVDESESSAECIIEEKLFNKILKDKKFENYSKNYYKSIFDMSISSWQEYILSLDEDSISNIEKTIKFLSQYTLSQYACLVITDDNRDIVETFSTNSDYDPVVIDYISNMRTGHEYYIENKSWCFSLDIYSRNESPRLFFPIYLKEKQSQYSRRFKDLEKNNSRLMAYIYLESNKVINNINVKTYENIKKYEPLLAIVLNDYKMTQKATVDKLTGIYIRSYVQDKVERLFERKNVYDLSFSILMLDIDHFKDVNDTYGHTRGDEVLQNLASVLKSSVRKSDIVGRYGGEEFVIVLMDVKKEVLKNVAEKIRLSVEKAKLLGDDRPLTVSVGAASYPQDGKTFGSLIENADKALYTSKNNGRNMVSVFDPHIAKSNNTYDNLSGVMGISSSEDNRRMNAILEIIKSMSKDIDKEDMIQEILSRVMDIVEANGISIYLNNGNVYTKIKNNDYLYEISPFEKDRINEILSMKDGYFVDWKDETYVKGGIKTINWSTYIVSSLIFEGIEYGKVILYSSIREHEFEKSHCKFVASVSPMIASVIKDLIE